MVGLRGVPSRAHNPVIRLTRNSTGKYLRFTLKSMGWGQPGPTFIAMVHGTGDGGVWVRRVGATEHQHIKYRAIETVEVSV